MDKIPTYEYDELNKKEKKRARLLMLKCKVKDMDPYHWIYLIDYSFRIFGIRRKDGRINEKTVL